jgi:uncharacterized protein
MGPAHTGQDDICEVARLSLKVFSQSTTQSPAIVTHSMLSPAILALLAATVVATSFISGIFGMAGGLILLGVLLMVLDVGPAMILFGATQAAANGWRAALWWRHVQWGLVWRFLIGSTAVFLALRLVALFPDKAWVYIGLGLSPFVADVMPRQLTPDITRPGAPYICGAIVMLMTLLAGVAGPILDVFYQKSGLDRRAVVATKAVTQTTGHIYRILYFGSFAAGLGEGIGISVFAGAIVFAILGTTLAARVLEGMSNEAFRRWSKLVITVIGLVYLGRGLWLLALG